MSEGLKPIDNAAVAAMQSYLRVCSSGGMSQRRIDDVMSAVEDAARLGYFTIATADHAQTLLKVVERAGIDQQRALLEETSPTTARPDDNQ